MQNQTGYLFTLELRIRKQIVKLNVYEDDSLNDLIIRLSKTVQYKQKYSQRLKEKLEAQFKKLVSTQNCSTKVQIKLESLTQESKLIIIGVSQGQKNDQSLNQTPFKILLDTSSANIRKYSVQHLKKQQQYNYDNYQQRQSPLIKKYNSRLTPQLDENKKSDEHFGLKYQYPKDSYQFESSVPRQQQPFNVLEDRINLKDYSPIFNISSKRKNSAFDNRIPLQTIAEEEERLRKKGCIRKINGLGNYQQNKDFNYKQSFQDYKLQKNKSQSAIARPAHFQNTKRNYISNQDDILMARYPQRLVYNQQQQALTKIDYSAKYIQGNKPAAGTRGNKKFSYLSQTNF